MPGDFDKEMFHLKDMKPDKFIESLKALKANIEQRKFKPKDLEQNEGNKAEYAKLNGEHIAKQRGEFLKANRAAMLKEIAVIKQGPAGSDPKSMIEWSEKFPTVLANSELLGDEGLDLPADQFEMAESWLDFLFGSDEVGLFDYFFGKSNSIKLSDRNKASYNKFVEKAKKLLPVAEKKEPSGPVRSYGGGGGGYGGYSGRSSGQSQDDKAENKEEEQPEEKPEDAQKKPEENSEVNQEEKPEEEKLQGEENQQEQPVVEHPDANQQNQPVVEQPDANQQNPPVVEQPDANQQGQPVVEQPDANQQNQPVVEQPDANQQNQPVEEQPDANQQNQPVEEQPDANQQNQPVEGQPDANQQNQPVEEQPDANQQNQPAEGQPDANQPVVEQPDANQPEEKPGPLDNIYYAYALHDSYASSYKNRVAESFDPSSVVSVLNDSKLIRALQASGGDPNIKPGDRVQPLFENINKMDEFFKKHEELVKEQYRQVTHTTRKDDQITTDDIEKAYLSLKNTAELKALHNPAAELRSDINLVLNATRQALNARNSSSSNYARLTKLDNILTVNLISLNAYEIINEAAWLSKGGMQGAASFEESVELESKLNKMHTDMDASLREKLQYLSQRLGTLGKTFSADTQEFTDFSTALRNAANGGSLEELKEAAESYAHLKNPNSQNGKDRLAIANQVSEFLNVVIPLTHEVAQAINAADTDYYHRTHATSIDKLLSPDTPKQIFAEEVSKLMAAECAKKVLGKDTPARKEITQSYALKLQDQLMSSDYETIRSIFDAAAKTRGERETKVQVGVSSLVENLIHPYDRVKNDIENQRENNRAFIAALTGSETEESLSAKLANKETKENIHECCCSIMMDKVLEQLYTESANYLRVDQEAFSSIYDQIRDKYFPEDQAKSLQGYKDIIDLPARDILKGIKLPEGVESVIPPEELEIKQPAEENKQEQPVVEQPDANQQNPPVVGQPDANQQGQQQEEKQPGEKQPEEKQPGEKQPEEKQPEEKQPGEKQPGEKQPEEKQPGEKQPGEKQPEEKQPGEKQPEEKQPAERVEDVVGEIRNNAVAARQIIPRMRSSRESDRLEANVQAKIDAGKTGELIKASTDIMIDRMLDQEDVAYLNANPQEAKAFRDKASALIGQTFFEDTDMTNYANYFMTLTNMSGMEIRSEIGMRPPVREKTEVKNVPVFDFPEFEEEEEVAVDPNTLNETQKAIYEIVDSREVTRAEFIKTASDLVAREMIIKKLGSYPQNGDALRDRLSQKIQPALDNDNNLYTMTDLRTLFMPDATGSMTAAQQIDKGMEKVMDRFMPKEDVLAEVSQKGFEAYGKISALREQAKTDNKYNEPLASGQVEWVNAHVDLMLSRALQDHPDADYFKLDSDAARAYTEIARVQIADAYFPDNEVIPQEIEKYTALSGAEIRQAIENGDVVLDMERRAKNAETVLKNAMEPNFWKTENGVQTPADPADKERLSAAIKDYLVYKAMVPAEAPVLRTNPDAARTFRDDTAELVEKRLLSGKLMNMEEVGRMMSFDGDDIRDFISPYDLMTSERYDANKVLHADLLLKKRDERTPKDENEIAALSQEFEANRDKIIEACVNRMAVELIPRDLVIGRDTNPADGMPFYREAKWQIKKAFFPDDRKVDAEYVEKMVNMSPKEIYQQIDLPENIIKGHILKTPVDQNEVKLNNLLSPETSKEKFVDAVCDQVVNKRLVQLYGDRHDPKYVREEDTALLNRIRELQDNHNADLTEIEKLRAELCESPNFAMDPLNGKTVNLTDFRYIRSTLNDNVRKTMMELPMEQLRECFEAEPGETASFAERLNNGLIKLTENVSRKADLVDNIAANAEAGRKSLQEKIDSARDKAWDADMYPAIINECTNVMLEKFLPEKELEYKYAQTGVESYKSYLEEARAQIITELFPASIKPTPEYVQKLMTLPNVDMIKKGMSEVKQATEKSHFMNDRTTMMGLQKRANRIIANPKAPAWEIREAAADYLIYGNFRRNRKMFEPESLYRKTASLNMTLDPKLYKEAREALMSSPAFAKLCENPKMLQRRIAAMRRDATMDALLAGYEKLDREYDPKKYEAQDKIAAQQAAQKAAQQAANSNAAGNNYAHLAESARQAAEAGERSLSNMQLEDSFKKAIKELYAPKADEPGKSSMEIGPREEMLFKLVQNYVPDGAKMANTTRQWISTALYQKKNNIDNTEMLKKISDGMRYINYKGLQYLEQHAAQCNKMVKDECSCGPEQFIKNWEKTNVVVSAYRTVYGDGKQPVSNPECEKNIKSILSMQDTMKKRMDYLTPSVKQEKVKKAESQLGLQ